MTRSSFNQNLHLKMCNDQATELGLLLNPKYILSKQNFYSVLSGTLLQLKYYFLKRKSHYVSSTQQFLIMGQWCATVLINKVFNSRIFQLFSLDNITSFQVVNPIQETLFDLYYPQTHIK